MNDSNDLYPHRFVVRLQSKDQSIWDFLSPLIGRQQFASQTTDFSARLVPLIPVRG